MKLKKIIEQVKNRMAIFEEENQFLRSEFTKVSMLNISLNHYLKQLDEKVK